MKKVANYSYVFQKRPEMLPFIPHECTKFIEVGCGDGAFSSQLKSDSKAEVWGVELNKDIAQLAVPKLDHVLAGDFFTFLENNELPKSYFDCIIFNDVLEHFPNPELVLQKIKTILKPSGFIVSSLPNFRYVGNLWEILVDGEFKYKDSGILDRTHFRFFTFKSAKRLFEENGYEVVKIHCVNPTRSIKVKLFTILSFYKLFDIPYMQIASLARLK